VTEILEIDPEFARLLAPQERSFDGLMSLDGKVYRAKEGRRTLRFERGGRGFFIKQHHGVGWGEIAKNLASLRLPVLGADHEHRALQALAAAGIGAPRCVAFGRRGADPARRESFIVTAELPDAISLEDLARDAPSPPAEKRRLVAAVGRLARHMHDLGINHRDFYLCHILKARDGDELYLIDLHRAGTRPEVPRRWLIKDLGGLLMSALEIGLTRRDRLRFVAAYAGKPWRRALEENNVFWRDVERNAVALKERLAGRDPSAD
jgi:heptose I phosphotransferase